MKDLSLNNPKEEPGPDPDGSFRRGVNYGREMVYGVPHEIQRLKNNYSALQVGGHAWGGPKKGEWHEGLKDTGGGVARARL